MTPRAACQRKESCLSTKEDTWGKSATATAAVVTPHENPKVTGRSPRGRALELWGGNERVGKQGTSLGPMRNVKQGINNIKLNNTGAFPQTQGMVQRLSRDP